MRFQPRNAEVKSMLAFAFQPSRATLIELSIPSTF
jgi:hypothetical protein